MNRRNILILSATAALGLVLQTGNVFAQQKSLKDQLIGNWSLASWEETYPDGHKEQQFGPNPKGEFSFDSSGHFTEIVLRPDLPKLAGNDRARPSSEEALAIAKGILAIYGTYTVDEANKTVNLKIEGTSFTNLMGQPQTRIVTSIGADEFRWLYPTPATGGQIDIGFKRAN